MLSSPPDLHERDLVSNKSNQKVSSTEKVQLQLHTDFLTLLRSTQRQLQSISLTNSNLCYQMVITNSRATEPIPQQIQTQNKESAELKSRPKDILMYFHWLTIRTHNVLAHSNRFPAPSKSGYNQNLPPLLELHITAQPIKRNQYFRDWFSKVCLVFSKKE